ncbi:hypothetical protein PM082_016382 [Marasmius tenuissimus]|nr:hypothetical protein PM082_016382 [Marasmius tenuissimus]
MTFSPESQQYYSPQPTQNCLQPQVQTYKAPVLFWTPSAAQSTPRYGGHLPPPAASLTLPPPSNFSASYPGPHLPPNNAGRVASSSYAGVGGRDSTPSTVFRFEGDTGGPFRRQESSPSMSRSSTPTAAVSPSLNPLGYAQHNSIPRSSGFNSRQLPAFISPQPGSFSQPPRPPFSQTLRPPFSQTPRPPSSQLPAPASQPTQPFLQTPKPASSFLQAPKPKPAFPATVAWDEPIVNHNVDARNLRNNILPPLSLPPINSSPTPAARPFRPPSMSVQSSSQSQSFHDMHHQVHPHDDVSRPTTLLSHHSPLSISRPSSSQRTSNPSLSVLCPLAPCSQPPTSVASPPSRPSPSVTRPSTPTSRPPPSALRSSSSIASLMNPSSSSRDEEGSKGENPVSGDAESNWALAEQPSSATASKPSLGESERELKSRTTDIAIADACAELLAKHDQEWLDLATKKGWPIERVRRV